jgi:cytochrome c
VRTAAVTGALAAALAVAAAGCGRGTHDQLVQGGSPHRGAQLIVHYGCGACHVISGIQGANGRVGPELTQVRKRQTIAGVLPNTTSNMIRWLLDPPRFVPKGDMPQLGIKRGEARDIAAYLYTQ